MNPKISVIIPYMETDDTKHLVLERLLDSLHEYTEIIVVENWKEGYAVPINFGLSESSGDYLVVMNDDLVLRNGTLQDLVDPNFVTSPLIDGKAQPFWGCCFCIPAWVYNKIGGLDERYRISYFDDDDYINELRKAEVPMKSVSTVNFENVDGGGRTLHTFPDHQEFFEENKKLFIEKWGNTPGVIDAFYEYHKRLPQSHEVKNILGG